MNTAGAEHGHAGRNLGPAAPSVAISGASVALESVSKTYGDVTAVEDVSLSIGAGEFLAILGPSGCGKSTLLRMIGGLEIATAGRVLLDQVDHTHTPANQRPTATVFQRGAVFPHLSVYDNVAYPLQVRRRRKNEIREKVSELLRLVRLDQYAARLPSALSGGQLQRVAVARALAAEPSVLLMDEPFSALDAELKRQLQIELRGIHRALGATVVFVTHDQDEALTLADRIAVMCEGRVEQCASPEVLYHAPDSAFVARFLGRSNVLSCTVETVDAQGLGLRWGPHRFNGRWSGVVAPRLRDEVKIALRPACITVRNAPRGSDMTMEIADIVFGGDHVRIELDAGLPERVWAELPRRSAEGLAVGAKVGVEFDAASARIVT